MILLSSLKYDANFSKEQLRNLKESIKLSLMSVCLTYFMNEMYFSGVTGITFMSPSNELAISLIKKWESYCERLWNTTGILYVSWKFKLHALWAAPRNLEKNLIINIIS